MNCARCGGNVGPSDLFCSRCGAASTGEFPAPLPPYPPAGQPQPSGGRSRLFLVAAAVVVLAAAAGTGIGLALTHGHGHADGQAQIAGPSSRTTGAPSTASTVDASSPSPSPTLDFATIYEQQQSGVVRIEVLGCSESGVGSGFLLSPTLVATVDHVVTDSLVVSLVAGDQHTTGRVIGSDPEHDLALVRADQPITGYHFRFADAAPRVGDRVAAIGFPIGDPITYTQGGVSGLERDVTVDGTPRTGLLETDTPINPGNSGGPLLGAEGTVIGLVDALNTQANGIAYAVPASQAQPAMQGWTQSPEPSPPARCSTPLGPSQDAPELPAIPGLTAQASDGIVAALDTYFTGINTGDYRSAYRALSPRLRSGFSLRSFADGDATSYDFDQVVLSAHQTHVDAAVVALRFTSIQDPDKGPDGDNCDVWTLRYFMIEGPGGAWYIDATKPYRGTSHESC